MVCSFVVSAAGVVCSRRRRCRNSPQGGGRGGDDLRRRHDKKILHDIFSKRAVVEWVVGLSSRPSRIESACKLRARASNAGDVLIATRVVCAAHADHYFRATTLRTSF